MTAVLDDRSFRENLVGLIVAAMLVVLVFTGLQVKQAHVQAHVGTRALQGTEMLSVEGEGWGSTILWVGVGLVVVGTLCILAAPVALGVAAAMVDAGATAAEVAGVTAFGTTAANVGGFATTVGGGAAAVGGALDATGH